MRLWGHHAGHIQQLRSTGENARYLPGIALPKGLSPESDMTAALVDVRDVLMVVPSHALRGLLQALAPHWQSHQRLIIATKGMELTTGYLPHEVAEQVLGKAVSIAVISGPTFAREVANELPCGVTVASRDQVLAMDFATYLHNGRFRAYTSEDIVGVEVGGAVKNVLAIAVGVADGNHFGANTRAVLITRGLAEIMRLGLALGGERETFIGLAGLGDLVLTCTDDQSRNRRMGLALAAGSTIDQAQAQIGQVVEGVAAARAVWDVAQRQGVDMPIVEQVYRLVHEGRAPRQVIEGLVQRGLPKPETH